MALTPRTALITGAASGIGKALAARLARDGWRVIVADRDAAAAQAAAAAIPGATAAVFDVTDRAATIAAMHAAWDKHGAIDLLVNNAGIGVGGEITDMDPATWRNVIDVNLFGVIHGIDALYPRMLERGCGHIVNVGSLLGLVPLPGEAPYVASKYAVVGLSHGLRAEARAFGVKVSVVCPGHVATPIFDTNPIIGFDKDRVLALWPRPITPEACADAIVRGIARNDATIVVSLPARALWALHRLAPAAFIRAGAFYMARIRRTRT